MSWTKVAVCDDVQKELEKVRIALDTYAEAHSELYFDIDEYGAAGDILSAIEKGKVYDVALLDICMPDLFGTDVAKKMLVKNPDMSLIFLTASDEYAVEAFAMNATHYLLKPFSQEQFDAALDRAVKKIEDLDFISLACVNGIYRVRIHEIISIESQNHYLRVYLFSGEILRLRMKLPQMFEKIQEYSGFIRVGASYVANLAFVRKFSGNTLEMMNGIQIPIPRRSREQVQKAYMDFCRREALQ